MKKKIGLFFGSYNPVHIGHLILARFIEQNSDLEEIWLVVTPQSPFKKKSSLLDNHHRLEMVFMACEGQEKLKPSDAEFGLPQPNYTINTLAYLEEKHPNLEFVLIMGEDNLKSFHKWKNHEVILERHQIYVYPRISEGEVETKFDEHTVKQMNHNIERIRYRKFGDDLLLLELVNVAEAKSDNNANSSTKKVEYKTVSEYLEAANQDLTNLYHSLRDYMMSLGDDVQEKTLKYYIAYKRIKNFACVEVHPQSGKLLVFVKVNPEDIELMEGFTRDVRNIGHYGTGDLEITIKNQEDLEKAEPLILKSYEIS
jgi:nicotinate-nucleotide adenylyltransferase